MTEEDDKNMYMNDQAVGALMMALQKSLLEQSDIVPVLKGMKFRLSDTGLMVLNPPLVKFDDEVDEVEEEPQQTFDFDVATGE
tara:strand:- start:1140 stop:1388 length:249 start_codon:yes stop_codon:yes gene_type:complete